MSRENKKLSKSLDHIAHLPLGARADNIDIEPGKDGALLVAAHPSLLRLIGHSFGSATAPVMYGIVRGFGGGIWAGVLGAMLLTFDNLNLGEARLVLIDSQLIFWCALTLFTAQRWWARLATDYNARKKWNTTHADDVESAGGVESLKRKVRDESV